MVTSTERVEQLAQDLRDAAADLEAGRLAVGNAQAAVWALRDPVLASGYDDWADEAS